MPSDTETKGKSHLDISAKLEGEENWRPFNAEMQILFEDLEIAGVVNGTEVKPVESATVTADQVTKWNKKDVPGRRAIMKNTKEGPKNLILEITLLKEIYNTLKSTYGRSGWQKSVDYRKELVALSYSNYKSAEETVAKYKTLMTGLKEMGCGITLKMGAGILLDAFAAFPQWHERQRAHFATLDTSTDANATSKIDQSEVDSMIKDICDYARKNAIPASEISKQALLTTQESNKRPNSEGQGGRGGKRTPCPHCKRFHGKTCYIKNPELAPDWFKQKAKEMEIKQENQSKTPSSIVIQIFQVLYTNSARDFWIFDSGANAHVCNDKNAFVDYNDNPMLLPEITTMGGVVKALGIGTVVIKVAHSKNSGCVELTLKNVFHLPKAPFNIVSGIRLLHNGIYHNPKSSSLRQIHDDTEIADLTLTMEALYFHIQGKGQHQLSKEDSLVKTEPNTHS